jgi:hypothetical protein
MPLEMNFANAWLTEAVRRLSEPREQIGNSKPQDFADSLKGFQRDLLLSAFNFANVVAVQVGFLRQFFLAESGSLAFDPNRFTDNPVKLLRRHHSLIPNQKAQKRTTGYEPLFSSRLPLTFSGDGVSKGVS